MHPLLAGIIVGILGWAVTVKWNESVPNYDVFTTCVSDAGLGRILVPRGNSKEYQQSNFQWQLKSPTLFPLAYALPTSESEVVGIVRCGIKSNTRVVALSGGHSLEKHSYGDSESVVIDFRKMNSVTLLNSNKTAEIGPGALAGPLVWELWNSGRAHLPIGSFPTVGITGLVTGGGFGPFARSYGLTVDYLAEANIVVSNGTLLTVNGTANEDLFWALRGGGGGSFGIITKLKFTLFPAPPIVGLLDLIYKDVESFPEVFDKWQHYFRSDPTRFLSSEFQVIAPGVTIIKFFDTSGALDVLDGVENLFPIPSESRRRTLTFPQFLQDVVKTTGNRLTEAAKAEITTPAQMVKLSRSSNSEKLQQCKTFYVKNVVGLDKVRELLPLIRRIPEGVLLFLLSSGGGVDDLGEGETAYVHRRDVLYLAGTMFTAPQPTPENTLAEKIWAKEFFDLTQTLFNHTTSYQNQVDHDLPNYLERYYGENLEKLVQVKKKYDPGNYFHNPQSVPTQI